MLIWIKTMADQERPFSLDTFNVLILKEYQNLYCNKKNTENNETNKIVTNWEHFTKNMCFLKWLCQLDTQSNLINIEVVDPLTYLQSLDTLLLIGNDLDTLLTLYIRQVRDTNYSVPEYDQYNGTFYSLNCDITEYGTAWPSISKLNTSHDVWGALIKLVKHYKGGDYNDKEYNNAYNVLEKES